MRYDDIGRGHPILLVSGFAWPASSWGDLGYVDPLVRSGYRVLTVDPLGHGLSEKPHEWEAYTAPDIGRDIVAVMGAAEVRQATVRGYSRGAALAAMAAAEEPERVAALVAGGLTWIAPPEPREEISTLVEALQRGGWALYYGSEDSWAPVEAAAEAFRVEPRMLAGQDHSGAIRDADTALRIVFEFLAGAQPG